MKQVIIALLILCAINWLLDRHFNREESSHRKAEAALGQAVTYSSTSYSRDQIGRLNDLVGRLSSKKHSDLLERQAKAYAEVYGLTEKDLNAPRNIFGE